MRVVLARGVLALGSLTGSVFALNAWLDTGERAWDTAALGTVTGVLLCGVAALARGPLGVAGRPWPAW